MLTCREEKIPEAKYNFNQIYEEAVELTWNDDIELEEDVPQVASGGKE